MRQKFVSQIRPEAGSETDYVKPKIAKKVTHMRERHIRFSITTDDIKRSISFYKDALGLTMRPICNPIAMFSFGAAEFEVCLRECSKELLEFEFAETQANGLLISLALETEAELERAEKAALHAGAVSCPEGCSPQNRCFRDFNGVNWLLSCRPSND